METSLFNYHAVWLICTLVGLTVALVVSSRTQEASGHILLALIHAGLLLYFGGYFILTHFSVVKISPWVTPEVVEANAAGIMLNIIGFALRLTPSIRKRAAPDEDPE